MQDLTLRLVVEDAGQAFIAMADLLANDTDADAGDTLSLSGFDVVTANGNTVSQDANGDLVFNLVNDYRSLGAGQSATDSFTYTIADTAGETSAATVNVTISGANDAPVISMAVVNQTTMEGSVFSYALPIGTFTDIDNGDVLTYTATLADGSALPAWLTFDSISQTFSGTPGSLDEGILDVTVTASDAGGLSASNNFSLTIVNVINGSNYNDNLVGIAGSDYIDGGAGNDTITGSAGNDTIIGGAGSDVLAGGAGDDTFVVEGSDTAYDRFQGDDGYDTILGGTGDDVIRVNYFTGASTVEKIDGGAGVNILSGTQYNDTLNLSGTELANIANIDGGVGNDTITGSAGNDVLLGGEGNDVLQETTGNNLLLGGAGADTITGGAGNEMFVGGVGNDTISLGDGADIIAFNRGDGADVVNGSIGTDNTITLGNGIGYADLALSKVNNDLILETGNGDQITLKSWYDSNANYKSVLDLQMIAEAMADFDRNSADPLLNQSVQNFDFTSIVNAFDQAHGGSATYLHWSMTNEMLAAKLGSSDIEAVGGDLSYQYGIGNTAIAGVGPTSMQDVLSASQFGNQAQGLRPLQSLAA